MLTHAEARDYYDQFGTRQDEQGHYEDPALDLLVEHLNLADASRVVEFGCGTGRFAERMLEDELPANATYLGLDISSTMVELSLRRLARFQDRALVRRTDGAIVLNVPSCDRFVSNYVLDLLADHDIEALFSEMARVVEPGGLVGLSGITPGCSWVSRLTSRLWSLVHRVRPSLVGGCRPLDLSGFIRPLEWTVVFSGKVVAAGIASSVVVLRRRGGVASS